MSDDMDLDIDDDDFEDEAKPKASLKEIWDNNPFLKIGLLIVVALVMGVIYTKFIAAKEEKVGEQSMIRAGEDVRGKVGEEVSPEYREAIEKANEKRRKIAEATRGSALPTPIGKPKGQLTIDDDKDKNNLSIDPLKEWRRTAEARSFEMNFSDEEELIDEAPIPEIVPIIEPIRPVAEDVMDPEFSNALAEQMSTIIATKEPKPSQIQNVTTEVPKYIKWKEEQEKLEQERLENESFMVADDEDLPSYDGAVLDSSTEEEYVPTALIAAGDIIYAQLLNNLNSDIEGPALAHILSGPLAGARAIGSFSKEDEYLVLTFHTLVKDGISYQIKSVALDPDTTLGAMVSDVDHHYFQRVIFPAAAEFLSGVGEGIAQTTTTVAVNNGGVAQSTQSLDTEEIIGKGVQKGFNVLSNLVRRDANREITVKLDKGTPMGLLFLETLYDEE